MPMTRASKIKIIVVSIIVLLLLVIAFQNWQPAETRILWMSPNMPRTILLLIAMLIGFIAGSLFGSFYIVRRR